MSTLKFFLFFISLSFVLAQVCEECTEPFGKSSWPECLHKDVEECKQIILKSFKRAEIQVIHDNEPITLDYRYDRVRIILNHDDQIVHNIPRVG